jgi:lipid-A-disaccharide synthase
LIADSSAWGAISITESAKVAPRVARAFFALAAALRRGPAGLFVPIDFGFVNVRLARIAKRAGWKVLYFVPPGSWRRDRQGAGVAALSDAVVTPFSWSAEMLCEMGARGYWFGHPIKQVLREGLAGAGEVRQDQFALLPGSRRHEIEMNLPMMAQVLRANEAAEFGLAAHLDALAMVRRWKELSGRTDPMTSGQTARVLARSRFGLICSGTVTLEAALCRTPMVVIYAISKTMLREAKLLGIKRPKYMALPNLILDRPVVPELLMGLDEAATLAGIRAAMDAVLADPSAQLAAFDELDVALGASDAITRTAELAAELLSGS